MTEERLRHLAIKADSRHVGSEKRKYLNNKFDFC